MIKLDALLKQSDAIKNSRKRGYLYNDVKFDLEFSRYIKEELYAVAEPKDLADIQDAQAIFNSVKNILTTMPGEKLLNPSFGLDLRYFLFEPITADTAYFIANAINFNLGAQEPRVDIHEISVSARPDENEYGVDILFSVPLLDVYNLNLKASLNKDGYVVI